MNRSLSTRQIWDMPVLLAVLSGVGLVSALLGDGVWDAFSWVTLGAPVLSLVRYSVRHQP